VLFAVLAREAAHRVLIVLAAAAWLFAITYLTPLHLIPFEQAWHHIDLNVLLLLAAMMAYVGVLKDTGVFEWAAARLTRATGGRARAAVTIFVWVTALVSAILDNVTTVIFVAPIAITVARALRMPVAALLLPVVMASNVGGAATLIGDPPNIIIGSGAGIPFAAFLTNVAAPIVVMIFVVDALAGRFYRAALAPPAGTFTAPPVPPISNIQLLRWTAAIGVLVFVGFLTQQLTGMPAAVPAMIGAAAAMAIQDYLHVRNNAPTAEERTHGILVVFERDIEWPTLAFFTFLFIVVGAAVETGLIGRVAALLSQGIHAASTTFSLGDRGTLLFAAIVICWASGLLSALVDNIPFVAVAMPVVQSLAGELHGDTMALWWALSLGACLGGNGSAVGASANVTVTGFAEREREPISFAEFMRFGVPVTAATLLAASAYLTIYVLLGARVAFWSSLALAVVAFAAQRAASIRRSPGY